MSGEPSGGAHPPDQSSWTYTPYLYPQETSSIPYPPPPPMPFPYGSPYVPPFAPQEAAPVNAGLVARMWDIVTHPSVQRMQQHLQGASWERVWAILMLYAGITAVLGFLARVVVLLIESVFFSAIMPPDSSGGFLPGMLTITLPVNGISAAFSIVTVPLTFFAGAGIYFGLAKLFGGQGRFLEQVWLTLLFQVPLGVIVGVTTLVPFLGSLAELAAFIYEVVLSIIAIAASHRLTLGKASAVVLIPLGTLFVLVIGAYVVLIAALITATSIH